MYKSIQNRLKNELKEIKKSGLFKDERIISSKQGSSVGLKENEDVYVDFGKKDLMYFDPICKNFFK